MCGPAAGRTCLSDRSGMEHKGPQGSGGRSYTCYLRLMGPARSLCLSPTAVGPLSAPHALRTGHEEPSHRFEVLPCKGGLALERGGKRAAVPCGHYGPVAPWPGCKERISAMNDTVRVVEYKENF